MTDLKEVKHHCVFCKEPILPDEKSGWAEGNMIKAGLVSNVLKLG
jgi:predicted nucleic acid-binding Zn ribbon protein